MNNSTCLIATIESLDPVAQIAAYRGIAHSALARAIYSARVKIRQDKRQERNEHNVAFIEDRKGGHYAATPSSLDQRNGQDENNRTNSEGDNYSEEVLKNMGIRPAKTADEQLKLYAELYFFAVDEVKSLAETEFQWAMTPEALLDLMVDNAKPVDLAWANKLSIEMKRLGKKITPEQIIKMDEARDRDDREELAETRSDILALVTKDDDYDVNVFDQLDAVSKYQIGVKMVESMKKASDATFKRVLRNRKLSDLSDITTLEEAQATLSAWVKAFEKTHSAEILEAIHAGRNLRSLDDLKEFEAA